MKQILILILGVSLLFSCKKKDDPPPVIPPGGDSTTFVLAETRDIVMYEVNLRAFSPQGNLAGVISRLDEIKKLGANVIWLMPIHPIGQVNSVNSPYSVKNYKEVSPEYGTLNDLKTLVKKAHEKGIAVIMDWVANHTAWDHPWISNKDWYSQDGSGNIIHPPGTNWMDVADLDYSNEDMRLAMIDAMKYWVSTADIDGYRCDAADMVPFDFWTQAISSVNDVVDRDLLWLAEGSRDDHFTAGFDLNWSWGFYSKLKDVFNVNHFATALITVHMQEYGQVPEGKHKLRFTTNHDESAWVGTPMVLFNGKPGALAASMAAITLGGVPLIYGSQEVGVTYNIPFFSNQPINWLLNPDMLKAYQDILSVYSSSGELRSGELEPYSTNDVLAFVRKGVDHSSLVIINVRHYSVEYAVPGSLQGTGWTDSFSNTTVTLNENIELQAYEYMILRK